MHAAPYRIVLLEHSLCGFAWILEFLHTENWYLSPLDKRVQDADTEGQRTSECRYDPTRTETGPEVNYIDSAFGLLSIKGEGGRPRPCRSSFVFPMCVPPVGILTLRNLRIHETTDLPLWFHI